MQDRHPRPRAPVARVVLAHTRLDSAGMRAAGQAEVLAISLLGDDPASLQVVRQQIGHDGSIVTGPRA